MYASYRHNLPHSCVSYPTKYLGMASLHRQKIHFVNVAMSEPVEGSTGSGGSTRDAATLGIRHTQRQARSHAARETHARTRRLRMIEHLRLGQSREPALGGSEQTSQKVQVSSPVGILPSSRKDPFMSFARPLSPMEHFLLDYCKCMPTVPYLPYQHNASTHTTVESIMADTKAAGSRCEDNGLRWVFLLRR